ncbi:MAG TPA: ABC transporter ATP-binding protein [Anaerolineae bacterium]|nr:ABC transporter ATP-binding protein [Anaerolineae bacterium]
MKTKTLREILLIYLRPVKWWVVGLALLLLLEIGLQLLNPQIIRYFLDTAQAVAGGEVAEGAIAEGAIAGGELLATPVVLWQAAGLFLLIALGTQFVRLVGTFVSEQVAWRTTNQLRGDVALHCLQLDYSFHQQHKPGELIERVDGDINQLANFFSQLIVRMSGNFLLVLGIVISLWWVHPLIGGIITLVAGGGLLVLRYFNRIIVPQWAKTREADSTLFGYLEEWLTGRAIIQTSRAKPYVLWRLYPLLRERWLTVRRAMVTNTAILALPTMISSGAYITAYLAGGWLVGEEQLSVGELYLVIYYIGVMINPLWEIQRQVSDLQRAAASLERVVSLLRLESEVVAEGEGVLPEGALGVRFEGVDFYYGDDPRPALKGVDWSLPAGKVVGIVGRTGSGKSTLTKLLLRFYDPQTGRVLVGEEDVREVSLADLRTRIGMVTQSVELLRASVRDNLTLWAEGISDERLTAVVGEMGLGGWLADLPNGLGTRLAGEQTLSAGEAQLLALARVFLTEPGLVILDEASSRLDPATEARLERALGRLLAGRTGIIIAHRLSTLDRVDYIGVMEGGELVEFGPRAELVARPDSLFGELLLAMREGEMG